MLQRSTMENSGRYFCLDDILTSEERVTVKLNVNLYRVPALTANITGMNSLTKRSHRSSIESTSCDQSKQFFRRDSKLELPIWLASWLTASERGSLASVIRIPTQYSELPATVSAGATAVDLRKLGPSHFYLFGIHLCGMGVPPPKPHSIDLFHPDLSASFLSQDETYELLSALCSLLRDRTLAILDAAPYQNSASCGSTALSSLALSGGSSGRHGSGVRDGPNSLSVSHVLPLFDELEAYLFSLAERAAAAVAAFEEGVALPIAAPPPRPLARATFSRSNNAAAAASTSASGPAPNKRRRTAPFGATALS